MARSLRATAALLSTELILVVDDDDPSLSEYLALPTQFMQHSSGPLWPPDAIRVMVLTPEETGNLTAATNTAAARVWGDDCIIGHVGDDHRFRTTGWDTRITEILRSPGVAAPNDGVHQGAIPTVCFMSSVIPRTLGWFALPSCNHLYIDNAWRTIGEGVSAYRYMPDVLIEHMHPAVGKAKWDEGYKVNNSAEMYSRDGAAFKEWQISTSREDIARVAQAMR